MSSPFHPPSSKNPWKNLGDFHFEELKSIAAEANLPPSRSYMVFAGGKAVGPVSIPVIDVTDAIPKGPKAKALAFCSGLAFSFMFSEKFDHQLNLKPKLCVTRSVDPSTLIHLESSFKLPYPAIIHGLVHSPEMKALVSHVTRICHNELIDHVKEYVGEKYGEEEKSQYVKMVEFAISSGLFEKLGSVEIWVMLNLQDRVMEVLKGMPLAKTPISLNIPSASATYPTPACLDWKGNCSVAEGSKRASCIIPDLNAIVVADEEEEADQTVAEEEANPLKKQKAESAAVEAL